MKSKEIDKFLDEMSMGIFGRHRSLALAGQGCVSCGKPATEFKDALSRKEYGLSGLCQACQDKVFGGGEE